MPTRFEVFRGIYQTSFDDSWYWLSFPSYTLKSVTNILLWMHDHTVISLLFQRVFFEWAIETGYPFKGLLQSHKYSIFLIVILFDRIPFISLVISSLIRDFCYLTSARPLIFFLLILSTPKLKLSSNFISLEFGPTFHSQFRPSDSVREHGKLRESQFGFSFREYLLGALPKCDNRTLANLSAIMKNWIDPISPAFAHCDCTFPMSTSQNADIRSNLTMSYDCKITWRGYTFKYLSLFSSNKLFTQLMTLRAHPAHMAFNAVISHSLWPTRENGKLRESR